MHIADPLGGSQPNAILPGTRERLPFLEGNRWLTGYSSINRVKYQRDPVRLPMPQDGNRPASMNVKDFSEVCGVSTYPLAGYVAQAPS